MKSILPAALERRVIVNGRAYTLKPTAANVLQAIDALNAEDMLEPHRLRLAVWHLYRWPRPRNLSAAVKAAFELLNEPSPYRSDGKNTQSLDLKQDAALIVAAFRHQYGIDLPREVLHMDWRVFLALLGGITDETRLGEIEGIRVRDLPKWTPYNGEARREMLRLKTMYAITHPAKSGRSFEDGLKAMAEILISMAGGEPDETPKAGDTDGGA